MIGEVIEAMVRWMQRDAETKSPDMNDKTLAVSCVALFRPWAPGKYKAGDIRTKDKVPYECLIDHDSTVNTDWTIDIRTIWRPYHSRSKKWALPFIRPTCAADMYKAGEYMVFTDGKIYVAKQDTDRPPTEYPQAWDET